MARRKVDPRIRAVHKASADRFGAAIEAMLEVYGLEVYQNVEEITKEYAKQGVKELRSASADFGSKYADGWTSRFEGGRVSTQGTIYNGAVPGLPHLLEHGHVTRNGTGRTFRDTPAHEHIDPVEKKLARSYYENVVKNL